MEKGGEIGNRKGVKGGEIRRQSCIAGQGGFLYSNNNIRVGLRVGKERRGFNWMCASLSGVLEKWG